MTAGAMTMGLPQPMSEALEKPNSRPPKAMVDMTTDGMSRRGSLSVPTFFISGIPSSRMMRASTAMMMNIGRQPMESITRPPSTGPMAGPAAMTIPAMPMAVPRSSTGNTSSGTVPTSGIRMPAPAACSTRPMIRMAKLGPTAHATVPTTNRPMDRKNSLRVGYLSMK